MPDEALQVQFVVGGLLFRGIPLVFTARTDTPMALPGSTVSAVPMSE
jgi:hypothetical protein